MRFIAVGPPVRDDWQDSRLCVRSPVAERCGAIKVLNQPRPIFKPPLATRADCQMPGSFRQKELAHIKGKRANFVVRVADKVFFLKRRSSRFCRQQLRFPPGHHVVKVNPPARRLHPKRVIVGPEVFEQRARIKSEVAYGILSPSKRLPLVCKRGMGNLR